MSNQLLQAVLLGGYYAIIACGLSFMFSVMKIINLAHGALAVTSAYLIWLIADHFGISPFYGVLIIMPVFALLGWCLQMALLEKSAKGGELLPVLTTFGLAIVIDNVLFQQFGPDTRSLAPYIGDLAWESWEIFPDIYIGKIAVYTFATALFILGGLSWLMKYTALGRAIRATAHDSDTAGLIGIDAKRTSALAAAIALMTISVAGLAMGLRATFDAYSGGPQLLFAFEVTVIGGVGSLWGTLLGGIVFALAQTLGASIHPQGFFIGGHLIFFIVLFFRLYAVKGEVLHKIKTMLRKES